MEPFVVHANAATAPVFPVSGIGVGATGFDVCPDTVFERVCITMSGSSRAEKIALQAATGLCSAVAKRPATNDADVAAIASSGPHDLAPIVANSLNSNKSSETLSCNIDTAGHTHCYHEYKRYTR